MQSLDSTFTNENTRGGEHAKVSDHRRLIYVMLFRVAVVTLLLGTTTAVEFTTPGSEGMTPMGRSMLTIIAITYGLTIFYALWLKRGQHISLLANVQLAGDLLIATALVHFTGGVESGFVFLFLLVIVGASLFLGRGAMLAAIAAVAFFVGISLIDWFGILSAPEAQAATRVSSRGLIRLLMSNTVAFLATGMLSVRLAVELKSAGEQIASQGARLRNLAALHFDVVRCLTSGLITVAPNGSIVTTNAAAEEILGKTLVHGTMIDEVLPELRPLLNTIVPGSSLRRGEVAFASGDKQRTLGVSISPLVDAHGATLGQIVNFQDLTDMRRLEEGMRRAEQLAAVGRVAAGVAHEIRNPLAAISGSIELLRQASPAQGDERALMDIVIHEVTRLDQLISDMLNFARPRELEKQHFELPAMVAETLRVFENDPRLGPAHVEFHIDQQFTIDADPNQLRQVLWNLLVNAAEASPPGQPIVVEVERKSDGARCEAQLVVRDHGEGLPAELRERIFEPFFSTKPRGTGLGLATVHRIVEQHGGTVRFESPLDGGTRVVVSLPM